MGAGPGRILPPPDPGGGGCFPWLIGIALAALVIALLSLVPRAHAHDPDTGQPNWITDGNYSGADGVHCCGPRDCDRLETADVEPRPDGIWLKTFGELVPWREATPSEDGRYWRCHSAVIRGVDGSVSGGERRCFFAPAGTQ